MSRRFGPGFLVAAAFIGPGTVTTATLAGAQFGFSLVWALLLAVFATMVLQEMAARLGAAGRMGLGDALRTSLRHPVLRSAALLLVFLAIVFGNAAYQAGNLTGASLGLEGLFGGARPFWVLGCALGAGILLWSGTYRRVERVLISLVALMGIVFMFTAAQLGPDLWRATQLAAPVPLAGGGLLVILALVGTTVVPYNLFLHASAVREKWRDRPVEEAVVESCRDTFLAVGIGGLVTLAILITAVPLYLAAVEVTGMADMARQLEPVLGVHAKWLFGAGLFAAGLTSAITAPLAAAWAARGLAGWPEDMRNPRFRAVWLTILLVGTGFAATGVRPVEAILLAQAANGLLLPVIAGFLLWVMNRRALLGNAVNGPRSNLAGAGILIISIILGFTTIYRALLM